MNPSHSRRRQAAEGQPTRGKTAPNRLRRVDRFTLAYDPYLIQRNDGAFADAWFVDLGFGADPVTTLEAAARLRRLNPGLGVLGVEIDPERVKAARAWEDERTRFRLGGFNLPVGLGPDAPLRRHGSSAPSTCCASMTRLPSPTPSRISRGG